MPMMYLCIACNKMNVKVEWSLLDMAGLVSLRSRRADGAVSVAA